MCAANRASSLRARWALDSFHAVPSSIVNGLIKLGTDSTAPDLEGTVDLWR
jgi:hypothetical protein